MRRPIKAHLVNRSNRPVNRSNQPVNRSNRPVYRYEPVELSFLNSNLNATGTDQFPAKPDRYAPPAPIPTPHSKASLSVRAHLLLSSLSVCTDYKLLFLF